MKNRYNIGALAALCGGLMFPLIGWGTMVSDVIVRQLAPASGDVVIDFMLAGVSGPTEIDVSLKDGGSALGEVPAQAFKSSRAFLRGGKCRIVFDPARVPALADMKRVDKLSVTLTPNAVSGDDVLYAIFDLEKATPAQAVTREALTNGVWGAWEETIWPNVTAVKTPVWTGVTNDTKYALTHLVMRRIDAGKFNFGYLESSDVGKNEKNYTSRVVTITKPYYIGVYPFTRKQIRLLTGFSNQELLEYPTLNDSFDQIRGAYTTPGGLYDWPTDKNVDPNSFIGKLRARTGAAFDLPTEAQWEKAARAGSSGVYYDGNEQTHKAPRDAIAWNSYADMGVGIHPVGLLKPNNYGLYDTLGNVWEYVLDWQAGGTYALESVDPVGAPAAGEVYWSEDGKPKRVARGASADNYYERVTLHERSQNPVNAGGIAYGWRVALPASEIDGLDSAPVVEENGVVVDARPNDTFQWTTVGSAHSAVQLAWPGDAQSAKLKVVRRSGTSEEIVVRGTESVKLPCAVPSVTRQEDVLTLTLVFFDGEKATGNVISTQTFCGLGLIAPTAEITVSDEDKYERTGKYLALPIPQGTTNMTIDTLAQEIGTGCCWFGWKGFAYNTPYMIEVTSETGGTTTAEVTVRPNGGFILVR